MDLLTETRNFKRELTCLLIPGIILLVFIVSCRGNQISDPSILSANDENITGVHIEEFILSPGDEIEISVYKYEGLSKRIKIPPDGTIFFPVAGEINTSNKSLKEIRQIVIQSLSGFKEQYILPGGMPLPRSELTSLFDKTMKEIL